MLQFERLTTSKTKDDPRPAALKMSSVPSTDYRRLSIQLERNLGNQALNNLQMSDFLLKQHEPVGRSGDSTVHSILRATNGSGESLSEPIKTFMEASLHTNLDRVRVHTDPQAAIMADQLGAKAFTYGRNIYFNSGQYDPATTKGTKLLAHELVHTIQQGFDDGQVSNDLTVSSPEEPSEKQADQVATQILGNTSSRGAKASLIGSMKTQLIQPKIQRAANVEVAVYETKDHGSGYEDAPDEDYTLEANSLNEAGKKLNLLVKVLSALNKSSTAIGQLSFYGHGAPGSQSVGAGEGWDSAKEISVASISTYANDYKQIYTPLSSGASVYLRGCNVGAGEDGLRLLTQIKSSCKTLTGKDIEAHGWTGKGYHKWVAWYDWYEQTGERVSSSDKVPKLTWEKLKERQEGRKK